MRRDAINNRRIVIVVEPIIQAPFELVDIEYGKIGSDMILSIFVDKPEGN